MRTPRSLTLIVAGLVLCALAVAGCSSDSSAEESSGTTTATTSPPASPEDVELEVRLGGPNDRIATTTFEGARVENLTHGLAATLERKDGSTWTPTHRLAADIPDEDAGSGRFVPYSQELNVRDIGIGGPTALRYALPNLERGRYRIVKSVSPDIGESATVTGEFDVR